MSFECLVGSDGGSDAIHIEEYLKDAELQRLTEGTGGFANGDAGWIDSSAVSDVGWREGRFI